MKTTIRLVALAIALSSFVGACDAPPDGTSGVQGAAVLIPLPTCNINIQTHVGYCAGCYDADNIPHCDDRDSDGRVYEQVSPGGTAPQADCEVPTAGFGGDVGHVRAGGRCPDARSNNF